MQKYFDKCEGFQWDEGNSEKNWLKHKVTNSECEQCFFNEPIIVVEDIKHSKEEKRWFLLGKTDSDKKLFLVFTLRMNLIRVISAREMNKKEKEIYNEEVKKNTEL